MCLTRAVFDRTNIWNPLSLGGSIGKSDIDFDIRKQIIVRKQTFRLWKSLDCGSSANSSLKFKSRWSLFNCDFCFVEELLTSLKIIPLESLVNVSGFSSVDPRNWSPIFRQEKLLNCLHVKKAMENNAGWFSYSIVVTNVLSLMFYGLLKNYYNQVQWKIIAIHGVLLSFARQI